MSNPKIPLQKFLRKANRKHDQRIIGLVHSAAVPAKLYRGIKPRGLGKTFVDVGNTPKESVGKQ